MKSRTETKNKVLCYGCQLFHLREVMTREDGALHTHCPTCRGKHLLFKPKQCRGWTDKQGRHHPCTNKTTDYRCPSCWARMRSDDESYVSRADISGDYGSYAVSP